MNFIRRHSHLFWLALIVLLAAGLRFYKLGSLPPGLWFDEAWSAVAARDTAEAGMYPLYYAANFGGMHPAIVYLTRLGNLFSGGHPLTIRYALAAVGTLTVTLSYFAYRAIWRLDDGKQSQNPLFATFALAIMFPYLLFTRMGFESSLVTPASLLVFWALAVALRRGRWGYFVLTGGLLGASLYVFDTARFLPFAVSAAYWLIVLREKRPLKTAVVHFGLMGLTAVFIFFPLALYFLQEWAQFTARAAIVTENTLGADNVPLALGRNLWHTIAAISLPGYSDPIARHNLPTRPIFDIVLSFFFWLGAGVVAFRAKRPVLSLSKRPSSITFISWAGFMLLPVILTDGAPTYTRIFGAIPAFAAIAGAGMGWMSGKSKRFSPILILLLLVSVGMTANDYFNKWAAEPQLFDDYQVGDWQIGQLARERLETDTVFLSPNLINDAHPTLDLLLGQTAVRPHDPACLVFQDKPSKPISYLTRSPELLHKLQQVYPMGDVVEQLVHPLTGERLMQLFVVEEEARSELAEDQSSTSSDLVVAQFGGTIGLLDGVEITEGDGGIDIAVTWQAIAPPTADHTLFIHVHPADDMDSPPLAQLDGQPCLPTNAWQTGEYIRDQYRLELPPELRTGEYAIALGWYTWPTFERLALDGDGGENGRFLLGK